MCYYSYYVVDFMLDSRIDVITIHDILLLISPVVAPFTVEWWIRDDVVFCTVSRKKMFHEGCKRCTTIFSHKDTDLLLPNYSSDTPLPPFQIRVKYASHSTIFSEKPTCLDVSLHFTISFDFYSDCCTVHHPLLFLPRPLVSRHK